MHRLALAALSLATLSSLFRVGDANAQEARARDSAGVRIIENAARKDAPVRYRLGDKPLLQVGGIESNPDEEFDHKQGYLRAVRLADGGLAVIDVSRVHYFDVTGKRVRIVGRKGQGPEEFQYLISVCRTRGDTLILSDSHNRRLSVLDSQGRVVRTILQGDNGAAPFSFCLDDGTFVLERRIGAPDAPQNRITRLRSDGSMVNVVGTFDAGGFDMVTMASKALVAFGDALYYGDPFRSEIREYDTSGSLRRVVRTADEGERITDAEAEERMAMTIPRNVTGDARAARMDRLRSLPRASHWPVFRGVEVGSDGTIWVQDYQRALRSPDAWTAIDTAGQLIGKLILPQGLPSVPRPQVLGFGRDYVMLRWFDRDGATSLVIFPLIKLDGRSR